tara:strand:- start:85 stop:762 length:678 start_codon:yes stop_codon:yes gene_type:complete
MHTPWSYQELADLTNPNKEKYCKRHGYDFRPKFNDFHYDKCFIDPNRPPGLHNLSVGFEKIFHIIDLIEEGKYEWIFWLGCDTLITNHTIKLEDVVDDNYHFMVAYDCNDWNVDSFLIRGSEEGLLYMKYIASKIDDYRSHVWQEQQAMIDARDNFKSITKVVPQEDINSFEYSLYPTPQHQSGRDAMGNNGRWTKGHFVVHWPGTSLGHRIQLANRYLKENIVE